MQLPWGVSRARRTANDEHRTKLAAYWSTSAEEVASVLQSSAVGLTSDELKRRLHFYGRNSFKDMQRSTAVGLFLRQFKSPLVLILVFAAIISATTGEWPDALIVLAVVVGSATLGFVQEYRAVYAIEKLRREIQILSTVLRDGQVCKIPSAEVVPGDLVLLYAGSLIPADGIWSSPNLCTSLNESLWG